MFQHENDAFQKHVEDQQVQGWEIDENHGDRVVLVQRSYGTIGAHAIIALLTVWWTLGIGNVCYLAYKYFMDSDKKVVREENFDA